MLNLKGSTVIVGWRILTWLRPPLLMAGMTWNYMIGTWHFFLGAWARRGRKLIAIKQERDLQDHILTNSSKEMGKYSRKLQIFYLSWAFPISIHFHLAESVLRGAKINLSRGVVAWPPENCQVRHRYTRDVYVHKAGTEMVKWRFASEP